MDRAGQVTEFQLMLAEPISADQTRASLPLDRAAHRRGGRALGTGRHRGAAVRRRQQRSPSGRRPGLGHHGTGDVDRLRRRVEHDACVGARADARNRHPTGDRLAASAGGVDDLLRIGVDRAGWGRRGDSPGAVGRSAVGPAAGGARAIAGRRGPVGRRHGGILATAIGLLASAVPSYWTMRFDAVDAMRRDEI